MLICYVNFARDQQDSSYWDQNGFEIDVILKYFHLEHIRSFFKSTVDIFRNRLPLILTDDGSHIDDLVKAVPDPEMRESRLQLFNELVENWFLNEQFWSGRADVTLIEPDGVDNRFDSWIEIGIFVDDNWTFTFLRELFRVIFER